MEIEAPAEGRFMKCVCCLVNSNGSMDRCAAATNVDQPFCNECEASGHPAAAADPNNRNFGRISMEVLQGERTRALAEQRRQNG